MVQEAAGYPEGVYGRSRGDPPWEIAGNVEDVRQVGQDRDPSPQVFALPLEPATFAIVSLLFTLVATIATDVPARRASRVDPMVALRAE